MAIAMTTTNSYANLVQAAQMSGGAYDIAPHYVAIGTGTTAPAAGDTALGAEVFRKAVTSVSAGTNPGELLITLYLSSSDAVGDAITEVGVFAGASASGTAGSGVLMGRALYSHTHTANESVQLQIDWTNQQV